jgi:hypothetical protein
MMSPGLRAEYINNLLGFTIQVLDGALELFIDNFMQDGVLPYQEKPTPAEERDYLRTPQAYIQAEQMMGAEEAAVRAQGADLRRKIEGAWDGI